MSGAGPEVLVLGALHLDVVVRAARLPRRGETLMGEGVSRVLGGKGANQAVAAAAMGARTAMAGRVGDDEAGERLLAGLRAAGVDGSRVERVPGASGMSVAIVEASGENAAVVVSGVNAEPHGPPRVPEGVRVLCLQCEVPHPANLAAARAARGAGARVLLNAAPARPVASALMGLVDVLVVNAVEAEDLTGLTSPEAAAMALRGQCDGDVVVTLGAHGAIHAGGPTARGGREPPPARLAPPRVPMGSTHGAGDALVGALAAAIAAGESVRHALPLAQAAAALHVSGQPASRAAAEALLAEG